MPQAIFDIQFECAIEFMLLLTNRKANILNISDMVFTEGLVEAEPRIK
jgi:hypothetical protein